MSTEHIHWVWITSLDMVLQSMIPTPTLYILHTNATCPCTAQLTLLTYLSWSSHTCSTLTGLDCTAFLALHSHLQDFNGPFAWNLTCKHEVVVLVPLSRYLCQYRWTSTICQGISIVTALLLVTCGRLLVSFSEHIKLIVSYHTDMHNEHQQDMQYTGTPYTIKSFRPT